MSDYEDLLVRVQATIRDGPTMGYTVELWLQGGRRVSERLGQGPHDFREPGGESSAAQFRAAGLYLFNWLFSGALAVAFQQTWGALSARGQNLRLRLALDPAAPELHAIPWELMHFDDSGGLTPPRPLAIEPRIAFSRYIESPTFDEGQPIAERPIRMLTLIASPQDLARWELQPIDRGTEEQDLRARLTLLGTNQLQYEFAQAGDAQTLQRLLTDGAPTGLVERGYDILLYMGHGLHHPELGTRLVLEDPINHRAVLYAGEDLVVFLKQLPQSHRPSLMLLIACNSAAAGTLNSLAVRLLIESGIPAVVGMQRLVEISLARSFTQRLSEQLLRDGLIDRAVSFARRLVFQSESLSWSTPVLYMRNPAGRLFSSNAQLEYVARLRDDTTFARWGSDEYIELGVLAVAPGQDWNLLRARPEDAPAVITALDALDRALGLGLRPVRRSEGQTRIIPGNIAALIGPPHSGQTTILQRLAYELASGVSQEVTRPLGIFCSLSGYEQLRGQRRLERLIVEQIRPQAPALADQLSLRLRQTDTPFGAAHPSRFVFLLDDLQSVPERSRLELAHELAALATRLAGERFLITSTQDEFPGQILTRAQIFVIQPLSERQILNYLRQRHEESAQRIFAQIREHHLLSLASDPSLLALIYELLVNDPQLLLTRNLLIQHYLDRMLARVAPRYSQGDAARASLVALAWQSRWGHREQLELEELFHTLSQVRRDRDYSLEELYELLRQAGLLTGVGSRTVRFTNPLLQAYCAAVALSSGTTAAHLPAIVALCASPDYLNWWEDVLYALAGLLPDPNPLFELLASAVRSAGSAHALLAARCLEATPTAQLARLRADLRAELLDACVVRLSSDREPLGERREQIIAALGRLRYQEVRHELRRLLTEKVRPTLNGLRYEYTNVRVAAARALRNIYSTLPATSWLDHLSEPPAELTVEERANDAMLERIVVIWAKGLAGRAEFRQLLLCSPSAPERALAAFALGDMLDQAQQRMLDARQLLRVILRPGQTANQVVTDDQRDTMWAAADALTLFEPELVAPLLTVLISRHRQIPDHAAQQLAYLAGRVRARSQKVIDWLIGLLVTNPSQTTKARALQSLAWMGMDIPQQSLSLRDRSEHLSLKALIEHIAAGSPIHELSIGRFEVRLRDDDPLGDPIYLRIKAVEALAWIGDAETLGNLGVAVRYWPIQVREAWYVAAATIKRRLRELQEGARLSLA